MEVFLNGKAIDSREIMFNDGLNFGRFSNQRAEGFLLLLWPSELIGLIEKEYDRIRDEIREDDITYDDDSDFKRVNYCSLQELLRQEYYFEEIFKTYLDRILLNILIPGSHKGKYVINSVDSVEIHNQKIVIKGRAFKQAQPI